MADDYYKTLDVAREASQADIEKAYKKLARKYHPDLNPDDKTAKKKFQEVQKAFDVLNDPGKRELYDRYGSSFENMGAGGPGGPRPGGRTAQGAPGFEDFDFSQFFGERFSGDPSGAFGDIFSQVRKARGGGGRRGRAAEPATGGDLETEVEVPFNTAVSGGAVQLSVSRDGHAETINVKIPAGIEDGKKIRLRGQGQPSPDGGSAGNLLITVRVAPHPFFTRRGDDLIVKLPVTLREAAEGAKVDVPTPKGVVSLRVPAGTSSGAKLRIKGYGVEGKGRPAGDLFAEVQIMLPPKLEDADLEPIRQIDARHPLNPRDKLAW